MAEIAFPSAVSTSNRNVRHIEHDLETTPPDHAKHETEATKPSKKKESSAVDMETIACALAARSQLDYMIRSQKWRRLAWRALVFVAVLGGIASFVLPEALAASGHAYGSDFVPEWFAFCLIVALCSLYFGFRPINETPQTLKAFLDEELKSGDQ